MLNLLPQEERNHFVHIYRMKLFIVIAVFAALLFVVAIIGLFPSYVSEKVETTAIKNAQTEEDLARAEAALAEARTTFASNKILADYIDTRITSFEGSPRVSSLSRRIFAKRNEGITISSVDISKEIITVRGVSASRSSLINFHAALRTETDFKDAILPISDLAKNTDATFTIQIPLVPPQSEPTI